METIKISDVIIPKKFIRSTPRSDKVEKIKCYVERHNEIDKPIVINSNRVLVSNYIRYLIANQYGFKEIPFIIQDEIQNKKEKLSTTYIIGKFKNCNKKYIWKNTKKISVNIGDKVLVISNTKNGTKKVVVTVVDIFQSSDLTMLKHKPMIKNLSLKNKNKE